MNRNKHKKTWHTDIPDLMYYDIKKTKQKARTTDNHGSIQSCIYHFIKQD